uniref:Uncharacterized protein n=1 Tax=Mesocestoides corti TaxID=53468 RepID=A0A5K3F272_MESCO
MILQTSGLLARYKPSMQLGGSLNDCECILYRNCPLAYMPHHLMPSLFTNIYDLVEERGKTADRKGAVDSSI